ncbi:hypothetical protein MUB24_02655 [Lederbergia sp. NSJ-179]|uniref:hypothetical protein n=1 Tax=Lederbergia sp. NSJ-179 TaxID=2931402 RepID=UPI001FD2A68F|nr:hypothetical protein [Lederbergia sp. NSJ-179]MCJ7839830.1 hypothetical protein [Lederbergia sp. NSJ-179]
MKSFWVKNGQVLSGGILQGMGLFYSPFYPFGGAGGILFQIHVGLALCIVNFSMLTVAIYQISWKKTALWTVVGIAITPLSIRFVEITIDILNRNIFYDLKLLVPFFLEPVLVC